MRPAVTHDMCVRRTGCGDICSDVPFSSVCGTCRIGPSRFPGPGLRPLPRSSERRLVQDQMTCVIQRETRLRLTRLSIGSTSQSSDSRCRDHRVDDEASAPIVASAWPSTRRPIAAASDGGDQLLSCSTISQPS